MPAPDLDTLVSLAKRRGFVFPSSDIYGGFASTWDYGPLGAELVRNIKEAWWRDVVHARDEVLGTECIDSDAPAHLGSLRPPGELQRSIGGVRQLPAAPPAGRRAGQPVPA